MQARTEQGFAGRVSGHWNIGNNPNGGFLTSLALSALAARLPDQPHPLSVTTHFMRPGVAEAPCSIDTDVLRQGRSLSTARASLNQEGKQRIEVLAAMSDLNAPAGDGTVLHIEPPALAPPAGCVPRSEETQGVSLPILNRLDIRLDPACATPGASERAWMGGWIRFRDGRAPDARALALFCDAFPPSLLPKLGTLGWVPTIELTVHVRALPAAGWIRGVFECQDLHDGRMVETGALWDDTGRLVAQSRQLGLLLPR